MSPISVPEMLLRLGLAFLAGGLVGWERESRGRAAGLRTTILTCVASAMGMLVSETMFGTAVARSVEGLRADPARLAAGFLAGMGFLGAGTIIRHENAIRGVTTAATLWFVTILGFAFGSGAFTLGAFGLGISLLTLLVLEKWEKKISADWYATLMVKAQLRALSEEELLKRIEGLGVKVLHFSLDYNIAQQHKTMRFELKLNRPERFDLPGKVVADLEQIDGVEQVMWE